MVTLDEKLISDQQKKIEECCLKLGKQYYAAHKDDENAEFADIIGEVKACEKVIADHKEEVRLAEEEARKAEEEARRLAEEKAAKEQRIKELLERELMPCPNCDAEIYYKSVYCNFCGIKIDEFKPAEEEKPAPEEPENEEPVNEEPVNEEQPVDEQVITTPPTKVFEPAASAEKNPEPKAEKKLCANCGAELEEDCLFCTECGTPVTASVPKEDEADAADNVRFCVECGFKVTDPEAVFCNSCGARLQPVGSEKTVKSDPQVKRCPNCGFNTTDPEVMFCIECGTKLP